MCCIKLYLLLVIKRALSTDLVGAGVIAQTVLIVGLSWKSVLEGVVFLARTCVLICFFKEIKIQGSVFFLNWLMTVRSPTAYNTLFPSLQHIPLLFLSLLRRFTMSFDFYGTQSSVHKQLSIVHAELKVNMIPILYEMPAKILNRATHQLNSDIMPRHSRYILPINRTSPIILRWVDIRDSIVAVIYSWPKLSSRIG